MSHAKDGVVPVAWRGSGPVRYGGDDVFWHWTRAYSPAEAFYFAGTLNKIPRSVERTQAAAAGWPGHFVRTIPARLPPVPSGAAVSPWFAWLSERCVMDIASDEGRFTYEGKIMHITLKPHVVFYVLLSWREPGEWKHELLRVRMRGTPARPFDGSREGASWPGPDELQAPGVHRDDLWELAPNGREPTSINLWTRPLSDIVVAVGPAPHLYLEATFVKGDQVWVVDDGGSVLCKEPRRLKKHEGYAGDARGRYSRMWVNKDAVTPVLRTSLGYQPGALWKRRNAFVLYSRWNAFKTVESWYEGDPLFNYDFEDAEDVLQFHSFLLISPLGDAWLAAPSAAEVRERCTRAERLVYDHLGNMPHVRGGVPPPPDFEDDDGGAADDAEEDAAADEQERTNLSGFPHQCCIVWGKMDGVLGKVPPAAVSVVHIDAAGEARAVANVNDISFPEPTDAFHAVAQSSLLNTAQLSSLYSTTGTRCHLTLCFEAVLSPGTREIDPERALFVPATHALAGDKKSPYDVAPDGSVAIKVPFHRFVFDAFYTQFVRGALDKLAAQLGTLVLIEYPVYHPYMLIGRTAGPLKRPQTVLDSVYRAADGALTLVDFKTLMEARNPNYRLLNLKNLRQVVTNATLFQLMTKLRVSRVALAYITRSETVTLVSVSLASAAAVVEHAALKPLKDATHALFNTATHYGVGQRITIGAIDDLGVSSGAFAGEPLPPWLALPEAKPPPRAAAARARSAARRSAAPDSPSPPPPPPRRSARTQGESPTVGAPLENLYVDPEAAAAAVVGAPAAPASVVAEAIGRPTRATRAAINETLGVACQKMFDALEVQQKARLRGRADALFQFLAHGPLFPSERVEGGTVDTVRDDKLNAPQRYEAVVSDADLRPEVVQVLIRTAQRLLNARVVHAFARTRAQRAAAEVAEGVTTRAFLENVLHHSRRDLWSEDAVDWAAERAPEVVRSLEEQFGEFLE